MSSTTLTSSVANSSSGGSRVVWVIPISVSGDTADNGENGESGDVNEFHDEAEKMH